MTDDVKLGATGEYPDGKLDETDEGELKMAVSHDPLGNVRIDFGKQVSWFMLPRELAIDFAKMVLVHAGAKLAHIELFDLPKETKQ